MSLILKIAFGIIIGYLAIFAFYNVFYLKPLLNNGMENTSDDAVLAMALIDPSEYFIDNVYAYYRKHGLLPAYISDLSCKLKKCPEVQEAGVFYLSEGEEWMAIKPYLDVNKLKFECRLTERILASYAPYIYELKDCTTLNVADIPDKVEPSFLCDSGNTSVEKIICGSDRLIDLDLKLSEAYENVVTRASDKRRERLETEQIEFIISREKTCYNASCIESYTRKYVLTLNMK